MNKVKLREKNKIEEGKNSLFSHLVVTLIYMVGASLVFSLGIGLAAYANGFRETGSLNLTEQKRIRNEIKIKRGELESKYSKLEYEIFGSHGYADTDTNGVVDAIETVRAYEKIGIDNMSILPAREPTVRELEEAIISYQTQK